MQVCMDSRYNKTSAILQVAYTPSELSIYVLNLLFMEIHQRCVLFLLPCVLLTNRFLLKCTSCAFLVKSNIVFFACIKLVQSYRTFPNHQRHRTAYTCNFQFDDL